MGQPSLIASQSGRVTPGLPALVTAGGADPVATVVTERAEDGRYYLSPGTLEAVKQRASTLDDGSLTLVVDGTPHPGQLVDLQMRLEPVTVVDRRRAVWEHLADTNPVADARVALREARLERRRVANTQRDAATQDPSGTSGALDETETRVQRLRDALEQEQETARRSVEQGYTDVDARVVLVGRVGAPTTALWTALTGESVATAPGRPTQPRTATANSGPHTLAVTDTPGVPGRGGLPDWLTAVVPGLVTDSTSPVSHSRRPHLQRCELQSRTVSRQSPTPSNSPTPTTHTPWCLPSTTAPPSRRSSTTAPSTSVSRRLRRPTASSVAVSPRSVASRNPSTTTDHPSLRGQCGRGRQRARRPTSPRDRPPLLMSCRRCGRLMPTSSN